MVKLENRLKISYKIFIFTIIFVIFYLWNLLNKVNAPILRKKQVFVYEKQNFSENSREFNFDYFKLKNKFNLSDKYFFEAPFISSDYKFKHIFGNLSDFKWNTAGMDIEFQPESVKCGNIVFIKTDYVNDFFIKYHSDIKHPYILITHESDYHVGYTEQLKYLMNDSKIIMWFAQNIKAKHPKLSPLPLGVVASEGEDFSIIKKLTQKPIPYFDRKNLLYLNFNPNTNKNREAIRNYFKDTFGRYSDVLIVEERLKWKEYLENLGNSQFVLSPPGNGIDCLRTWEALYMGAVPIVLKNELMPLYENMPVMIVENWTEVTEENLFKFQKENLLENFSSDEIPLRPKLWLRYWINEIMSVKENYVNKFC